MPAATDTELSLSQHSPRSHHTYTVTPRVLTFPRFEGHVLLLKGAPTKPLWPNLYNGVGGHVEPGETIKHAALRELEEETSIRADNLLLCGMVSINLVSSQGDIALFVFTCTVDTPLTRPSPEGALEWFTWNELPTAQLMPDLPILLPRIRAATEASNPFYALYTYDEQGSLHIDFDK